MLEMAAVHSVASNAVIAWARIASWSDRVKTGDNVIPRSARMIPSDESTSVIQISAAHRWHGDLKG